METIMSNTAQCEQTLVFIDSAFKINKDLSLKFKGIYDQDFYNITADALYDSKDLDMVFFVNTMSKISQLQEKTLIGELLLAIILFILSSHVENNKSDDDTNGDDADDENDKEEDEDEEDDDDIEVITSSS